LKPNPGKIWCHFEA